MKRTFTLLAALAVMASCKPAAAEIERTTLSQHGPWEVVVEVYDSGVLTCAMRQNNETGIADFTLYSDDGMTMFLTADTLPEKEFTASLYVETDDAGAWDLPGASFGSYTAVYEFDTGLPEMTEFLAELANGQTFKLLAPNRLTVLAEFSLEGSRDAMKALADCGRKLQTTY